MGGHFIGLIWDADRLMKMVQGREKAVSGNLF